MKRTLLFILLFLLMMPLAVNASQKIDGIYYNLDPDNKTAEVVFHTRYKYSGDLMIPSSVTHEGVDYSVTGILANAFRGSSDLTSVTIPSSVLSIGVGIFDGCTSLASVVIEGGNPKYDSRESCNAIIETASNTLLIGCKSTTIPNGVTSIANSAFNGCTGLIAANIPNSVTSIGESAFEGCSGMTSITIGNGVTTIGNKAFKECSNLTKVEINNNEIVSKPYNATPRINDIFGSQVKEYVLGEDVKSIGEFAFAECPNLITVHLSEGLTSIGSSAFYLCSNLTEINIPSTLTSLGQSSFYMCYRLTKVVINNNALVSNDYSSWSTLSYYFGNQVEEYILGEEVTGIGNYAFSGSSIHSINIPSTVTKIGDNAFASCSKLTSVNIPKNVTSIGNNAFQNCTSMAAIQIEHGNTIYDSREDCNAIIKTADNTLLFGCQNTIIPNSITAIEDRAFYNCAGLTSITIPNSVTSIGDSAFYSCTGLAAVSIPNSIKRIGHCVFCGCAGLTSISIPNSVTSIGQYAFASCKALTTISLPNSVTAIGDYAFFSCSGLSSITIPSSVTSIGYRVFNNCFGLTGIQVESGNTVYDSREDCNAIIETASNTLIFGCQNTIIPNSVTVIGECAFWNCSGLSSITIPDNVTSIGRCAFYECSALTSISIPNSVTSIEYGAFADCWNLATVIIGKALTNIGEGAFVRCSHLKNMYCYAEQIPKLGNNVFDTSHYAATLHVPEDFLEAYNTVEQWMDFGIIVALTDDDPKPTGIQGINNDVMTGERYYSLGGKCTTTPQRGLNIIRMSNGTTKKIVIQ